ncbi:MAG TPA: Uma2 family endonuclease [Pirellulales bacterium]|jgi:Uma2 family endonuclease|nr:Uma2 family endonuclease [Pirellulales bacterium]
MATLITDPELEQRVRTERAGWGIDRYDEVWDGTYMLTPLPNLEHAEIQTKFVAVFRAALGFEGPAHVYGGINISDRAEDWLGNYRCPDAAIVLPGNPGRNCGAYFLGGPDFVVEIVSPHDKSRDKIAFYESLGVREFLVVDRNPWMLELYRLRDGRLELVGQSRLERANLLASTVLPVTLRLTPGSPRPRIDVRHADGLQHWLV